MTMQTRSTANANRPPDITIDDLYETFKRIHISDDVKTLFEKLEFTQLGHFLFAVPSDFEEPFTKSGEDQQSTLGRGSTRTLTAFHTWCQQQRLRGSLTLDRVQTITMEELFEEIATPAAPPVVPVVQPSSAVATSPVVVKQPKRVPLNIKAFDNCRMYNRSQWVPEMRMVQAVAQVPIPEGFAQLQIADALEQQLKDPWRKIPPPVWDDYSNNRQPSLQRERAHRCHLNG